MAAHGVARNSIAALPFLKLCLTLVVTDRFNLLGLYHNSYDAFLDHESTQIIEIHNQLGIDKLDPGNLRAIMVRDLVQMNNNTTMLVSE